MHTFANLPLETSRVADTNCSTQQAVATYGFAAGALASNADELTDDVAQPHGNEVEFVDGMARVEYLAAVTAAIDNAAPKPAKPALFFLDPPSCPVLTNGSSAESIFRRADANLSGAVDFDECDPALPNFMPPDVLLMLFLKVHARGSVTRRAGDGSGGQRLASENRSHCCNGAARHLTILCAESYPSHSRMHYRCRQPAGVFRWCFRRGALCGC